MYAAIAGPDTVVSIQPKDYTGEHVKDLCAKISFLFTLLHLKGKEDNYGLQSVNTVNQTLFF